MVIRSLDLHPLLLSADRVDEVAAVFSAAGRDLQNAGAQLAAVASFTGHRYVSGLIDSPIPFVDLTRVLAGHLRLAGYRRVAVWATSYALGDENLMSELALASGARLMLLPEATREQVDSIVFNELAEQKLSDASLLYLRTLFAAQVEAGAQALLLATTDFSPLASLLGTVLPIIDATALHCTALVDAATA